MPKQKLPLMRDLFSLEPVHHLKGNVGVHLLLVTFRRSVVLPGYYKELYEITVVYVSTDVDEEGIYHFKVGIRVNRLRGDTIRLKTMRLKTMRLKTMRLKTIRLDIIRLETISLDTISLDTIRLDIIRLDTIRLDTIRLDTIRLETIRLDT